MGSLGCLESHVRAWELVVERNIPMLVLEEDVHLDENLFSAVLPYLLYSLPKNFSLLYFGNLLGKDMESKLIDYNDLLWKVNGSNWGTYAYVISPQAAVTLLDYIHPVNAQVDSMIINIALSQSFNVFMSKQILVKTDNKFRRLSYTQRYLVPPIIIPRIFHFIWLNSTTAPASVEKNIRLWKELHPNWQIRLWTNASINNAGFTFYNRADFENTSRSARQISDVLRYDIIYQYGGIYVDLDFEPLKNIEALLHGLQAFVVYEDEFFICNGIFGAIPGHELTERLVTQLNLNLVEYENGTVNQQTGPHYMTRQIQIMQAEQKTTMKNGFQMFSPHIFFPVTWYEMDPGPPYDPTAFAIHHFRSLEEIQRDVIEGR
jgi:hypothetical protein